MLKGIPYRGSVPLVEPGVVQVLGPPVSVTALEDQHDPTVAIGKPRNRTLLVRSTRSPDGHRRRHGHVEVIIGPEQRLPFLSATLRLPHGITCSTLKTVKREFPGHRRPL